ncbi:MAG: D-alanyl-D-alanine carboxypeptidase, partial [Desulfurivibrionaceae bacterium]
MALLKESLNLLQAATFVNKWRHTEPNNLFPGLRNSGPRKAYSLLLAAVAILLVTFVNPLQAPAGQGKSSSFDRERRLDLLIGNGAYGLSGDHGLHGSTNLDLPLIPASVIKILTGLAAFEELGPDYRFRTEFFIDGGNNLYIKGYGDPFLISEEVEHIMISLKKSGCRAINDIYLDDNSHRLATMADGVGNSLNPYDVASSALAVNFNTVNVRVDPNGTVHSGEPQTPLLPMMTRVAENLP